MVRTKNKKQKGAERERNADEMTSFERPTSSVSVSQDEGRTHRARVVLEKAARNVNIDVVAVREQLYRKEPKNKEGRVNE